jgi:hypothetical protein
MPSFSFKYICFDAELRKYCETHTKQKSSKSSDFLIPKNSLYGNNMEGDVTESFLQKGLHDNKQSFSCMSVLFYEWDITLCIQPS